MGQKIIQVVGILAAIVVVVIGGLFLFEKLHKQVEISGTVAFTGLKPDPADTGTLVVQYKRYNTKDQFKAIGSNLALENNAQWQWEDAIEGQTYIMVAQLVIDGKVTKYSDYLTVTAPASTQQLEMKVAWKDLPVDVIKAQKTNVGGTIKVNGYIPPNSSLQVTLKPSSGSPIVLPAMSPVGPTQTWEWNDAVPLETYRVYASLISGAQPIGISSAESIETPDSMVDLTLNSEANPPQPPQPEPTANPVVTTVVTTVVATPTPQPTAVPNAPSVTPAPTPVVKGTIVGTIHINGPKDKDTSLLIMWRTPGKGEYNVIQRINYPPVGDTNWTWDGAVAGSQYEITAALQVNNQNTATTNSSVVAAPAQNVNFTLNTGVSLSRPGDRPYRAACDQGVNNLYTATVGIPRRDGVGNYWLRVGTNDDSSNTYNQKFAAQNNNSEDQKIQIQVDADTPYTAKYAYSKCINCTSDLNYSAFSDTFTISCP